MEEEMNWIQGDKLFTHTSVSLFHGQANGKLIFVYQKGRRCFPLWFTPKVVKQMIDCGEWVQVKFS